MRRRTFLKALLSAPALTLRPPKQEPPAPRVTYTDSQGNSAATLAALSDGLKTSGGVEYQT